jgi:hypothetical protein
MVTGFLILATAAAAHGDGLVADADNNALTSPHPTVLAVDQAVGTTVAYPFSVTVGNTSPASNDVFAATGDFVTVAISREGTWVDSPAGTPTQLTLTRYLSQAGGTVTISVPRGACDVTNTTIVGLRATASNGQTMSPRSLALTFRITGRGECGPADADGDGVADDVDNCPAVANTNQADADGDGVGDLCDRNAFAPGVGHAAAPNPASGPEGSPLVVNGSFADADGDVPVLTKTNGRGAVTDNGDGSWSWSLTPADDGGGSVQVKADDGAHSATDTFLWSAENVAPTADISNDGPIAEGGSATVSLTNPFDPSSEDTTAGFHYAFSCTNDALPTTYGDAGTPDSIVCSFADDGSYTVSGRIFDKDDGYSDYATTVVVWNVAPIVTSVSLTGDSGVACLPGNAVGLDFAWTDPAGANDTYSYDVDWGDGSHDTATSQGSPVSGLTHTYGPGAFTISIVVSDGDGGASDAVTRQVNHVFATSGLLQPINAGGRTTFKLGSTIPVKLRVTDCTGAPVDGLDLRVHLAKGGSDAQLASSNGDTGMRYTGDQYLFNLSTKRSQFGGGQDLTAGTYHLWVGGPVASTEAIFDLR